MKGQRVDARDFYNKVIGSFWGFGPSSTVKGFAKVQEVAPESAEEIYLLIEDLWSLAENPEDGKPYCDPAIVGKIVEALEMVLDEISEEVNR